MRLVGEISRMNFCIFILLLIQLQADLNDAKSEELEDEGVAGDQEDIKILSTMEQAWLSNIFPSHHQPSQVLLSVVHLDVENQVRGIAGANSLMHYAIKNQLVASEATY